MFNMKHTGRVERSEITALTQRVEELEKLVYEPRMQALLDEYRTYTTRIWETHPMYVSGKRIVQFQGYEYKTWTEEEFRKDKLNAAKAKAYDDHKCPEVNPNPPDNVAEAMLSLASWVPQTIPVLKRKRRK